MAADQQLGPRACHTCHDVTEMICTKIIQLEPGAVLVIKENDASMLQELYESVRKRLKRLYVPCITRLHSERKRFAIAKFPNANDPVYQSLLTPNLVAMNQRVYISHHGLPGSHRGAVEGDIWRRIFRLTPGMVLKITLEEEATLRKVYHMICKELQKMGRREFIVSIEPRKGYVAVGNPERRFDPLFVPNSEEVFAMGLSKKDSHIVKIALYDTETSDIAKEMGLSKRSVKEHFRLMFKRFGITEGNKRVQLLARLAAIGRKEDAEEGPVTIRSILSDHPKYLQIVELVAQGHKNERIGALMGTTEFVIKNYLREIYDLIGCFNRREFTVRWSLEEQKEEKHGGNGMEGGAGICSSLAQ